MSTILAYLLPALAMIIAMLVFELAGRLWLRWSERRFMARLRLDLTQGLREQAELFPESRYIVQLSASAVSCLRPDGTIERVEWDDLQRVDILTTDRGPFLPDVFWMLHGLEGGCAIPSGATGEMELLKRLQQLPGFRNEAVIEAAPGPENRGFLCWEREKTAEPGAAADRPRE